MSSADDNEIEQYRAIFSQLMHEGKVDVANKVAIHIQAIQQERDKAMGFPIKRTTVAAVGGGGAGGGGSSGQSPRMSIHERAEAKLCARMDWMLLTDAGIHIHIHALQDKVFIFGVKDGNHFVLEDTSGMFPSDTTVTQLRMVCDGRQQD